MVNTRIIIIDDDKEIWNAYRAVLAPEQKQNTPGQQLAQFLLDPGAETVAAAPVYDLSYAPQGQDGFERVKADSAQDIYYSVAFIDIRMPPGWDGVQTAQAIRQVDKNIEIVIVTAFSDLSRREIVQVIGTPDKLLYLRKPFDAEELGQVALSLTEKWSLACHEREQKEEITTLIAQLQQTKDYLDSIIDSMPSVLVGVDENGGVTHWNRQAQATTNIGLAQARGQTIETLLPNLAGIQAQVKQAIDGGQVQCKEKYKVDFGQGAMMVDITVYPLPFDQSHGAVIRIDDVTRRVRMEELMIQSDKMLSVGGLAAGMAHEINTPLGSIIQNAQIMVNRLAVDLPKNRTQAEACGTSIEVIHDYMQQRGFLQLVEGVSDAGRRTAKIVKSMLSFSRQSTAMAEYNVHEIVEESIDLAMSDFDLKKNYRFRDFDIVREFAADALMITCEKTKIEQVILNLLKNAAHAMAEMPRDHAPQIILRVVREAQMVRIEVEDNGPGIDEATCKRVFEPFFTTKEIGFGTGLGLSLAYFIITENHKGKICVLSQVGKGAKFILQLPYINALG